MRKIKLSVLCITYNHEKFIKQTLDSFIMQKTNFPFEVLIHDDASTDKTATIIREYAKKYPNIIKSIFQKENQFSKGVGVDRIYNWPRIKGEYVALCEGDDYWTDNKKLQKQVDFLECHKDYSICFHPVKVIWEDKSYKDSVFPTPAWRFNKTTLQLEDLIKHNFIQTNSVVYRWRLKNNEDLFPNGIIPGDWFLHLLHAQTGKIGFLTDVMSVYRKHAGGIWWGAGETDEWFFNNTEKHLAFYKAVERQFLCDKTADGVNLLKGAIKSFLRTKHFEKIEIISKKFPDVYEKSLTELDKPNLVFEKKYKKYKKLSKSLILLNVFLLIYIIFKIAGAI